MPVVDKDRFLKENCGLIKSAAYKYYFETPKFSFDDLVQIGNQGALKALDVFDHNRKDCKITTYVRKAADREIRDFVRKNKHDIYVSSYQQKKHYDAVVRGETDEAYSGPNSAIALRLDKFWDGYGERDDKKPMVNVIPSGSPPPEQQMIVEEQKEILMKAIKSLPERERGVIIGHHLAHLTFVELGAEMGVTKQRVKQIEAKAMKKLKTKLEKKIDGFIARSDGLARR